MKKYDLIKNNIDDIIKNNIVIYTFYDGGNVYNVTIKKLISCVDDIDYYYINIIDVYNNIYNTTRHYNYDNGVYYYNIINIYDERNIKVNNTIKKLYDVIDDINSQLRRDAKK